MIFTIKGQILLNGSRKKCFKWPRFFGYGWSSFLFTGNRIIRSLNKINILTRLLSKKYKNYRGVYNGNKVNLLRNCKFSYCISKGFQRLYYRKKFSLFFNDSSDLFRMSKYFRACSKILLYWHEDFKNLEDINSYIKNILLQVY